MRLFQRDRPCEELARLSTRVKTLEDEMRSQVLRYEELYELARRNLAKMAQRAAGDNGEDVDPLAAARAALVARKLKREA